MDILFLMKFCTSKKNLGNLTLVEASPSTLVITIGLSDPAPMIAPIPF
jgi:hypothetical protein